jgi:adenine/guanine phosphoribosyltransferase-like PRPP-binding protein
MQNNIDKDINLFFPKESNFLLLGGNFLFSKRLYEIIKRQSKIKRIDYKHEYTLEHFPCINDTTFKIHLESFKKIKALIELHNANTLIFTSEILLFLSDDDYLYFVNLLKEIAKLNIKLIFISIANPLHICKKVNGENELSNMASKNWYSTRLTEIENLHHPKNDLIYKFSSYCTYITSNLQTNPLELLGNDKKIINICQEESLNEFSLSLADDIIQDIILNLSNTDRVTFNESFKTVTLSFIQKHFSNGDLYSYINTQSKCSLNLIYRKKPYEITNNDSVANWRFKLGYSLKKNIPEDIIDELDIIIPIPETGKYYAQGLSSSLNKPYLEAFYKQSEIGRSFDINDTEKRNQFINSKLGLLPDLIKGKNIGIVDEAIFTGQTLKIVSDLLQNTLVKKIYFFIASPVCKNKCKFNMQPDRDLLCENKTLDDLISHFNVNGVFFQDLDSFKEILSSAGFGYICCFSK